MSNPDTRPDWSDPDDAPELTDEWFDAADLKLNGKIVRRGRPRGAEAPKEAVTLGVSAKTIERYKALGGADCRARMSEILEKAS